MFPRPYFGFHYFPPRYWPQAGPRLAGGQPSRTFSAIERVPVYRADSRSSIFERAAGSVFNADRRGNVFDAPVRCDAFSVEDE